MRVSEKIHCIKINKYFFRKEPEGPIFKYKQFCMRKNCKIESSYNYENIKKPRYCQKHKKPKYGQCQTCPQTMSNL